MLNEFLNDIKQSGHRPEHITIKSDAESVYIHGLFQQQCRELGMTSVYSPLHEHERNGSSEKAFRDIGDLAHTIGWRLLLFPLLAGLMPTVTQPG